ncbi:MAG: thioredoxin family protein [Phycisphaerae bacterium]|nr:thioredoxin family protein [Phycisphaerae bacterium]
MHSRTEHHGPIVSGALMIALAVNVALATPPVSAPVSGLVSALGPIEFLATFESAKTIVGDAPKPIVLQFGASWCGWCKKLEEETLNDADILRASPRLAWVHVDIDEFPQVAARYGVRGVPHAVIVDGDGVQLAQLRGFADAAAYLAFLTRGETLFTPENAAPVEVPTRTLQLVETMAPIDLGGRAQCIAALKAMGSAAHAPLVELLADERLAIRAAAAHALGEITDARLPFDPFGASAERDAQRAQWAAWLTRESAAPSAIPSTTAATDHR